MNFVTKEKRSSDGNNRLMFKNSLSLEQLRKNKLIYLSIRQANRI